MTPDISANPDLGPSVMGPAKHTAGAPSVQPPTAPPDASLVEQTRREIAQIAAEMGELAKRDIPPDEFYGRFLPAVISALGAMGGAVWNYSDAGELSLKYQVNLASAQLDDDARRARHTLLLRKTISDAAAVAVPPQSGSAEEEDAGNPTPHLLLHGPLIVGTQVVGVVEVFQRADAGPATQRGYLRFLTQMAELASGYLKSRSLRKFTDRQQLWQQLEQYISRAHGSLDPRETAYTIVNEGRRLVACDRVSLLIRKGRNYRVEAVSGVDRVDARAVNIRRLEKLVTAASATGEALWYHGDAENVPPQIEEALHSLVDETHAHTVAILPLRANATSASEDADADSSTVDETPLGALVIEQFQEQELGHGFKPRVQAVADHGAAALANALDHNRIFLLRLWQWIGSLQAIVAARNLPKTILALLAVGGIAGALTLVPASFELEGRGTLEPSVRRDVFAGIDGTVIDVPIAHGQEVAAGQTLATMRSTSDLDVAVADLVGKKLAARERMEALDRELLSSHKANPEDQDRLSGELFQLRKTVESIDKQLLLYQQKQQQLTITSPIRGQVVTWQVRDRLMFRPVRQGQSLLTVVDPTSDWQLEVQMPQRRVGHLKRAALASDGPLPVTFMLATHPGQEFTGYVQEIGQVTDAVEGQDPSVVVRVAIDKVELPELRPGATVSARVKCGRRPLGYVWLHDVLEFVQSQVLFRL